MTNSLAGLFCSSLGQIDASITASPEDIFPDSNIEGDFGTLLFNRWAKLNINLSCRPFISSCATTGRESLHRELDPLSQALAL
jgi:hypothetical protein